MRAVDNTVARASGDVWSAVRDEVLLAGVNSINWARVKTTKPLFHCCRAVGAPGKRVAFSVPTGYAYFAGYVAAQMGLPVAQVIAAM